MEEFQMKGRKLVIRMPKELDHHNSEKLRRDADRLITECNINQVEFDFRDTEFMDSSGIGVIMGRYQNIRLLGGVVEATHVNDRIFRILQISGVSRVIVIDKELAWNQNDY